MWMDPDDFLNLVRLGPLVAMDLVVRDPEGRILVGRRVNRPAQGWWFVPGGRMAKGETLDEAFRRICRAELGQVRERAEARFLGVYEHLYEDNFLGVEGVGTHYVVLGHELRMEVPPELPADQHADYAWMTEAELRTHPEVHANTKAYV